MKRRELLKNVGIGALVFPLSGWTSELFGDVHFLNKQSKALLDLVSSTFIPEGKQKGARGVGVVLYLDRYISDCLNKEDQQKVQNGIDFLKSKDFMLKNQSEREQILLAMQTNENQQWFYDFMRSQTILAYTNSAYVLTNFYGYVMAPGFYNGCIKV